MSKQANHKHVINHQTRITELAIENLYALIFVDTTYFIVIDIVSSLPLKLHVGVKVKVEKYRTEDQENNHWSKAVFQVQAPFKATSINSKWLYCHKL